LSEEVANMIRVTIERHCQPGKEEELERLLVQLRSVAMLQHGYVSGETLQLVSDHSHWMVISTWLDATSWKVWEASSERQEFASKMGPLLTGTAKVYVFRFVGRGLTKEIAYK